MLRLKEAFETNLFIGIVGSLSLALIYNIFAYPIFSLLTENKSVLENCVKQVRFLSFSYVGIVVSIILNSLFIGTGKPMLGLLFSFVRLYIFLIPACLLGVLIFNINIEIFMIIFITINAITLFFSIFIGNKFCTTLKKSNIRV